MSIKYFKWHAFIPVFLLFFSYVFGVAVELLGGAQLFVRVFVLVFCVVCSLFVEIKFSVRSIAFLVLFLMYAFSLYLVSGGAIVLNFIYLGVVMFYLNALRVGREELLYYSLVASFLVIFLYVIYFCFEGVGLEPVTIGERTRYYFGFTNPNKVGIVSYSLIVLSILYFFKDRKFLVFVLCAPFIVFATYSDSRTSLYALALFVGLACIPWMLNFRRLMFLVPMAFLACSFYISYLNDSEFANLVLSNRPTDFHEFISDLSAYDFFVGANSDGYRVDNSYILTYFAIGPLGFLLFIYLLFRASRGVFSRLEFSFVLSIMAYGMMEGILVRVEFPVVIYFYYLIVSGGEFLSAPREARKLQV